MVDRRRQPEAFRFLPLSPVAFDILLALSDGERHGYGILREVALRGGKSLRAGTLYRALSRLLGEGLIQESEERPAPDQGDERRRYYSLTTLGRDVARAEAGRLSGLLREALAKKVLRKADL
jgi:DNA-binding PadR family transcriptional regulator